MSAEQQTAAGIEPTRQLPTRFGVAFLLDCSSCGTLEYSAAERDRAERMEEFHDQFCGSAALRDR